MPFYHRGSWNRQYPHAEHEEGAYQQKGPRPLRYVEETNEYGPAPFNVGGRVESRKRQHSLDKYYQEQLQGRWGRTEARGPQITPEQGMGSSRYGQGAYNRTDAGANWIYENTDRATEIARRRWELDKRGLEAANYGGQYTPSLRYYPEYHQYQPYGLSGYGPELMSDVDRVGQARNAEREPLPGSYGRDLTGFGSYTMPEERPPQNRGGWRRIDVQYDGGSRFGPSGRFGHQGWTGRHGQYGLEGPGTHSIYDQTSGILQAGEQMGQGNIRSREEPGRLYGMSSQRGSGREPDRYERLYGMGSGKYRASSGSGSYGTEASWNSMAGLGSYGAGQYGSRSYGSMGAGSYGASSYGSRGYGFSSYGGDQRLSGYSPSITGRRGSLPQGSRWREGSFRGMRSQEGTGRLSSMGRGSYGYGTQGYGATSYGTVGYGSSGYQGAGPSRYGLENYGATGYGMRPAQFGTPIYGRSSGRGFGAGQYAEKGRSRGEVFIPTRYGTICERYNIPWQESVARIWGFPPQAGDIGTQDYCQSGQGRAQFRQNRGMQRAMGMPPQARSSQEFGGSGLQGSEFSPYGREMIRSGAMPLYERGRYSGGMRQITDQRRATWAQQPSLTGPDLYRWTAPQYGEPSRRLWEQYGNLQGEYSRPYNPNQFVTQRFAREAPSVPLPPSSSSMQGQSGQAQSFGPSTQSGEGIQAMAPGDLGREFSNWGFTAAMGGMPLYLRDIWSDRMRQIESRGALARRGSRGPSWDPHRQPWTPFGAGMQPSPRAPSYRTPARAEQERPMGRGTYPTGMRSPDMQEWGEFIAPGAIPLYEWEKEESLYRQMEANRRPASQGPSWSPDREPWAPSRQPLPLQPRSQRGPEFTSYGCDMAMAGGMSPRQAGECYGTGAYGFGTGRYGQEQISPASPESARGSYAGMPGAESPRVGEAGAQQIGGPGGEGEYSGVTSTPGAVGQMFGPTEQIPRPEVGETTCLMRSETGPYAPGSSYNKPRRDSTVPYRRDQCGL